MPIGHAGRLTRRGFCLCCIGATTVAAGGWLTPGEVFAQAPGIVETIKAAAVTAPIALHPLRGNVSVLEGSGGNIAVLTGRDGQLAVDCGIAVSRPRLTKALAGLSADPITHLINTHWHFDHPNGNEWVHSMGAAIVAHANTLRRLFTAQRIEDWSYDFPAPAASALPTEVFATERNLKLNDTTLALKYYGPAHTDGDISVTFAEADILHAADRFWNGIYPFIDYSTGGSIDGSIGAAEANKDDRDMPVAVRENVAALKQQGRSLDEIVAAKPSAALDAKWGNFIIGPSLFTKLVYEGV